MGDNKQRYIQRVYNTELQRVEETHIDPRRWEFFHKAEWDAGMDPFLMHVFQYMNGERACPICKTSSTTGDFMYFTFSDVLYRLFLDNVQKIKKPYETALKYGFRGYSRGGRNGVFLLRRQDGGLLSDVERLVTMHASEIMQDLDCGMEDFPRLSRVKIVCHEPGGSRVLGVMNQANGRAIFLGFGQY